MAESAGLENRCPGNRTVGSNPTPSAILGATEAVGSSANRQWRASYTNGPLGSMTMKRCRSATIVIPRVEFEWGERGGYVKVTSTVTRSV